MKTPIAHVIALTVLTTCPVDADNSVSGTLRKWDDDPKGVQVFILAGQSNMVGHGKADDGHGDVKGAIGSLRTTDARPFWRDASVSPSNFGYHWNHNGESQFLNGSAMGQQMVKMLALP